MSDDRGFSALPAIPSTYGGEVRVYESSAAMHPHVWFAVSWPTDLNRPHGERVSGHLHLTVESAQHLAEQLLHVVEHHYQGRTRLHSAYRSRMIARRRRG